jgi:hypothetical protein
VCGQTAEQEKVWREFLALPPQAQQQVADFIAFLRTSAEPAPSSKPASPVDWVDEPFVGMWREREDMQDSTWVRRMREQEW